MKSKKKWGIGIVLAMALMTGLTACGKKGDVANTNATDTQEAVESNVEVLAEGYNAGVYQGTTKGHNGDLKVEVELSNDAIVSVKILEHVESEGISDPARERIPADVVAGQTLNVDTVSGATVTSNALLTAIADAITQAGGNVEALKTKEKVALDKNELIEMTTDVVVIGGGGAGLVAAASADENGADVILLEKLAMVGGSTSLSGGAIAAPESRFQKEEGIEDSKESWMELWKERQSTSNPDAMYPNYDIVDKFMDDAVVTTEWLVDYVGHEYTNISGYGLDPVRRLHFPFTDKSTKGGTSLTKNVENFLVSKDVKILTETPATELIVDESGNVVGVMAEGREGTIKINAKKVILAAGGFAKNEEMLSKLIPEAAGTAELSAASAGTTGDGINMAEKVGAVLYEEPWVIGLGIATKVEGTGALGFDWTKVYVNGNGERFTNEELHYSIVMNNVMAEENPWLILDSTEANAATTATLEAGIATGEVVKADTIEELANAMAVPVETLVATMETYNAGVTAGVDGMGKGKDYLVAVTTAPYYAVKIYPKTMGTFGGVKTDENYNVLRADGSIINNLYAVGENANKVLYNQVYMTGSAVQFAVTSGRLAGAHAATNLNK